MRIAWVHERNRPESATDAWNSQGIVLPNVTLLKKILTPTEPIGIFRRMICIGGSRWPLRLALPLVLASLALSISWNDALALSASRPIRTKEQTGNPKKRSRKRSAKRLRLRTFAAPDGRLVAVVWGQASSPVASLDRHSMAGVTPLSEPERDELEQSLQEEIPAADAPATVAVVAEPPLVWPTVGPVSSPFGKRRRGFHAGIDISAPRGQSVVAAADGRVLYARPSRGKMGKAIVIQHDDGMLTIYAHLASIDVREETAVHQGDPIGTVGSTGRSSGPHLHFAVRLDGKTLDPQQFLRSADAPLLHVSTQ